jgi:catechol 2,3-dioxygenase-like lactoylglutathione lyase family enzyme
MPNVSFRGKAVTIVCTAQHRSERFYHEVLGAERIPGDGYGCRWFTLGGLTLSLMFNAEQPSPAVFPTHAMPMLWLSVDDLAAAHRHLVQNEVPIIEYQEGLFILVTDPDGMVIEVWQSDPESEGIAGI